MPAQRRFVVQPLEGRPPVARWPNDMSPCQHNGLISVPAPSSKRGAGAGTPPCASPMVRARPGSAARRKRLAHRLRSPGHPTARARSTPASSAAPLAAGGPEGEVGAAVLGRHQLHGPAEGEVLTIRPSASARATSPGRSAYAGCAPRAPSASLGIAPRRSANYSCRLGLAADGLEQVLTHPPGEGLGPADRHPRRLTRVAQNRRSVSRCRRARGRGRTGTRRRSRSPAGGSTSSPSARGAGTRPPPSAP